MKRSILIIISFMLIFAVCLSAFSVAVTAENEKITNEIESILSYKLKACGATSLQSLVDKELVNTAGQTAEWYALALMQYKNGLDFSRYARALETHAINDQYSSVVSQQKFALILKGLGKESEFVNGIVDKSTGRLGIMSYIFGLHLLNNGCRSELYSRQSIAEKIIALSGKEGWSLTGANADVDVTAMAIQALAPLYADSQSIRQAIDRGLDFLSRAQLESGGYVSYGTENPESTAQVIVALCSLGIDPLRDSRFIKNNKTLFDALLMFKKSDGSFSHSLNSQSNNSATVQTLYSLVAIYRLYNNLSSLYIFDNKAPEAPTQNTSVWTTRGDRYNTAEKTTKRSILSPKSTAPAVVSEIKSTQADTTSAETSTEAATLPTATETATAAESRQAQENNISTKPSAAPKPSQTETTLEQTSLFDVESKATNYSEEPTQAILSFENNHDGGKAIKLALCLAIALAAAISCLILVVKNKKSPINFISIIIIALGLILITAVSDIQTREEFKASPLRVNQEQITVSISIDCSLICGEREDIPKDGVIVSQRSISLPREASVFDALTKVCSECNVHFENASSSYKDAYIKGIANIYEFDFSEYSGWMYKVNGEFPSVGCGSYKLSDGDRIEWLYTKMLGEDLK